MMEDIYRLLFTHSEKVAARLLFYHQMKRTRDM